MNGIKGTIELTQIQTADTGNVRTRISLQEDEVSSGGYIGVYEVSDCHIRLYFVEEANLYKTTLLAAIFTQAIRLFGVTRRRDNF